MKALRGQTTGKYETRTLLGKEYLVVPVVAMIEGVRFGANQSSAELGLASEFGKFVDGWNTSPVVLNHPQVDGNFVSAGDPSVLEDYFMGEVFNTVLEDGKLKLEAWLDTALKDKSDAFGEVFSRLDAGEIVEVSVGFFTEVQEHKGNFKGQSYNGIWRNIVPDHLAFLSEGTIGACSVNDGCGTRVNSTESEGKVMSKGIKAAAGRVVTDLLTKKKKKNMESHEGCACQKPSVLSLLNVEASSENAPESFKLHSRDVQALHAFVAQAIPNDLLSTDIVRALSETLSDTYDWPYVLGYTNDYVVFEAWREGSGYQLYRQNFTIDSDGEVTFTSEPEEVRLVSKIVPVVNESGDVNDETNPKTETTMADKDPKAQQTENTPATETTTEAPATETPAAAPETKTETPATQAAPAKPLTAQEYISAAPAELQEVLKSSLALHADRKNQLIANLKATGRCQMTEEFLKSQSLETLEQFAKLADVPSYAGASAPVRTQSADDSVPAAPKVFEAKA